MNPARERKRLLWNDRSVVAFCLVAVVITVAVIALQMHERTGLLDPETVLIFYRLFLFQDYPASFLFIVVLLAALAPHAQFLAAGLAEPLGRHPWRTAAAVCVLLALGAVWVYRAHPLAMDEYAPVLQSRIFAAGRLYGRLPPELIDWLVVPGFQNYFIHVSHETGQIASSYWPGFALLLTPFTVAGVPWLCNPVLGALALVVIHRMTLELTGSVKSAGGAVLLSLASAAFVVNAISFYAMTAHLLCNAAFALLLFRPGPGRALAAGAVGGLALVLHNPVPHILFATPWLVWLVIRNDRARTVPAIVAGYLPWVVFAGFGWTMLLKGLADAKTLPTAVPAGGEIEYAVTRFASVFHWPDANLLEARLVALAKVWLWSAPATVLLAAIGYWRHRSDRRFQLLLWSASLMFVGYVFVPLSQGHGWGYRYFHPAWFVVPVFAAAALVSPRPDAGKAQGAQEPLTWRYAMGASLVGSFILLPYFAWQVHSFIGTHLAQMPTASHGLARVVIVSPFMGYYAHDLVQNDPFLREPVIHMVTHGRPDDRQMMEREFPDLVLLAKGPRGTVWGYPDGAGSAQSASAGP